MDTTPPGEVVCHVTSGSALPPSHSHILGKVLGRVGRQIQIDDINLVPVLMSETQRFHICFA